ncbi:hypothetical protein [Cylindrospermopsis raciborskii]|uniref:hypothetical protein n=1 Tax=Cylindrospermopsis raciborskii TaxID=77022 RepID=UPI003A94B5D6
MAKVIENTQRDLNIAFMNELALICDRMNIRTYDVLQAARTKWNFLPFSWNPKELLPLPNQTWRIKRESIACLRNIILTP